MHFETLIVVFSLLMGGGPPPIPDDPPLPGSEPEAVSKWTLFNPLGNGMDLSSETNSIGGYFSRSTDFHYAADLRIGGKIRKTDSISASGKLRFQTGAGYDSYVQLGHFETEGFSRTATDFVGIYLQDYSGGRMRAHAGLHFNNGALGLGTAVILAENTDYVWSYTWQPAGGTNGLGLISCAIVGTNGVNLESCYDIATNQVNIGFACNAFGLSSGYGTSVKTNSNWILVSDLEYSTLPSPVLPPYMRVFILLGQSNARGSDATPVQMTGLTTAHTNTFYFSNPEWTYLRPEKPLNNIFGPEIAFAAKLSEQLHAPVGIIKRAIGGKGLEAEFIPSANRSFPAIVEMTRLALSKLDRPIFSGVLTVQGETDADSSGPASRYHTNATALIEGLRSELGSPYAPYIISRLHSWSPNPFNSVVRAAQMEFGNWVNTDDLGAIDSIHFSAASHLELGERFVDSFLLLRNPVFANAGGRLVLLLTPNSDYTVEKASPNCDWGIHQMPEPMPILYEIPMTNNVQFFRATLNP